MTYKCFDVLILDIQRYGFVHEKPFLPGERYSISKEMERNVKGYKVIIIMINIIIKTKMLKMMVVFMIIVKNLPRANDGDHGFVIIMTRVVT